VIDTHCHLLPGLDDGPASDLDAVSLARDLAREGVAIVVCTPHFSERYPTRWNASRLRLRRLRVELDSLKISLETVLAAELSATMALHAPAAQLVERAIGGRYLLVELIRQTPASAIEAIERRLSALGLTPVLAHPERCAAVQRRPDVLASARRRGALVQVVAPSLAGRWGEPVWKLAWELITSGHADLLASDSHRPGNTDRFGAIVRLVASRCGAGVSEELTVGNPNRLLHGEDGDAR
jgi:protein-tyrosine phosphatase